MWIFLKRIGFRVLPASGDILAKRHLYIAGTGRAGTTFLVEYLTQLGFETTLSRDAEAAYDEYANAGYEEAVFLPQTDNLPYVCKSPWLYLAIDELIASNRFNADGVIIPIRDIHDAAASRISLQKKAILRDAPWMADLKVPWDVWANVPGGLIYSLDQKDEERNLATGFHILVERLTKAEVPFIFLHFPRFALDGDYLFRTIRKLLPDVSEERSSEAFDLTSDPTKIRIGMSEEEQEF